MFSIVIPVLFLASRVQAFEVDGHFPEQLSKRSAASDAQIRFAIENKYDDTGPGAKGRVFAYNTYKTLDDALVGYIDDPDTKLPEHERTKAIQKLYKTQQKQNWKFNFIPDVQKAVFMPTPRQENKYQSNVNVEVIHPEHHFQNQGYLKGYKQEKDPEPFKFHKVHLVKGSPLNLAHYTRDPKSSPEFNPIPQYTYSYGVHDKLTGDSKSAHETSDGGIVSGFYTFMDSDGKQRTVQYTADDKQGFRAIVRRTATNSQ